MIKIFQMVGSDIDHHSCPSCGCHDRERHLLLYLRSLGLPDAMRGKSLLHFAPEARLAPLIQQFGLGRYVKADLYPQDDSVQRVDLLKITFPDNSFDYIIANHVLEHVSDDVKALRELYRVLKPGGVAVLQTPYSRILARTFNDDGVVTAEARLHIYGQEDHVRIYGRDIFDRFATVGFVSQIKEHNQALASIDSVHYGVNPKEPLFLFIKPVVPNSNHA